MSINSLTNAAAARRPDTFPFNDVPKNVGEIADAANRPPTAAAPTNIGAIANQKNAVETALNVLFGYIPTEIITLYVTVVGAIQTGPIPTQGEWNAFICFVLATPLVVWLVYGAKLQSANKPLPLSYSAWPIWEMTAATLAFVAWSFALPRSPFSAYAWYSAALSGVVVLIVSTCLGLVAPFFQRPLKS